MKRNNQLAGSLKARYMFCVVSLCLVLLENNVAFFSFAFTKFPCEATAENPFKLPSGWQEKVGPAALNGGSN